MMRAFAEVLAAHVDEISHFFRARAAKIDTVQRATAGSSPAIVFQPIYRLRTGELAASSACRILDSNEIGERAIVSEYSPLTEALRPLRENGLRLAIDDAGAGYASMRHCDLLPDYIKLDMSLTQGIDKDSSRNALA